MDHVACRTPLRDRPAVRGVVASVAVLLGLFPAGSPADEGMWLFGDLPQERLLRDHDFNPLPVWCEHLRQAAVRFNSGGSGSFVSADGLVLTNHHVAASTLQKLSNPEQNIARDGFLATTHEGELRCPGLELNVLVSSEDVTERVIAAVAQAGSTAAAAAARRAVLAAIESESLAATGLRSDVVTLFGGGRYLLYRYRRHTDVRLVFAPERAIAFYGGDADNFEFPRHCLDICFFRAYEDGKPLQSEHFLPWARDDVAADDLIFVAGHPGHTDRGKTLVEIESLRDRQLPFLLSWLHRREVMLQAYAEEGREQALQAQQDLFAVQNSRKARAGLLAALLRPEVIARKAAAEATLKQQWQEPDRKSPWQRIAAAEQALAAVAVRYNLLEGTMGFRSRFFTHARTLLRAAAEADKPDGSRLREFRQAARPSLELRLFAKEPLYDAYEMVSLADSLTFLVTTLGADDPLVSRVLAGKSPADRAEELIKGARLGYRPGVAAEEDQRRRLYEGGAAAVAASDDAMLTLATLIDEESRRLRKIVEQNNEIKKQAHAELNRLRLEQAAEPIYPDATFTLRLAYGTVQGVAGEASAGQPWTTVADLFAKANREAGQPPFQLPPSWQDAQTELLASPGQGSTPLNFLSTADIIGGNSGSPVVNRKGELVGIIFDGNQDSLVLDVAYDADRARAIAVSAGAVLLALDQVYGATHLSAELTRGGLTDQAEAWQSLFDEKSLGGWEAIEFGGEGEVTVTDGEIVIGSGDPLSGIVWQQAFPTDAYEISLEAKRVEGFDFFCGLTFPVGEDCCSLILGGWGGGLTGLSSVDGFDASENSTTDYKEFELGRWYGVTVRVEPDRITCLLDGKEIISQSRSDHEISIRAEMFLCKPLGIASYATTSRLRNVRYRRLPAAAVAE
jgi:hypothetical protein